MNTIEHEKMYHTSPNKILPGSIHKQGIAGDCLFFSNDIYQMSDCSVYIYEADFNCVAVESLYDEDIINEISLKFSVDNEIAEALLDSSQNEWELEGADFEKMAEFSWWLQGKRGECAKKMGYDGCEDRDEQGTVYIIPMYGREGELKLKNKMKG